MIAFVQIPTDLGANQCADRSAQDGSNDTILRLRDFMPNRAANNTAEHCAHFLAVAATGSDVIVIRPVGAGVTDIIGTMLGAPAMSGRMRGRIRERSARQRHETTTNQPSHEM